MTKIKKLKNYQPNCQKVPKQRIKKINYFILGNGCKKLHVNKHF